MGPLRTIVSRARMRRPSMSRATSTFVPGGATRVANSRPRSLISSPAAATSSEPRSHAIGYFFRTRSVARRSDPPPAKRFPNSLSTMPPRWPGRRCREEPRVLVTFEGIEAAGKSTLIAALAKELTARGSPVLVTKEPGGTPFGDALRAVFLDPAFQVDPLAEVMILNASRAQLVADVIAPALKLGTMVLCDRFFDATVAYQGFGRGLDIEQLLEICLAATQRIAPDLTFVVDI